MWHANVKVTNEMWYANVKVTNESECSVGDWRTLNAQYNGTETAAEVRCKARATAQLNASRAIGINGCRERYGTNTNQHIAHYVVTQHYNISSSSMSSSSSSSSSSSPSSFHSNNIEYKLYLTDQLHKWNSTDTVDKYIILCRSWVNYSMLLIFDIAVIVVRSLFIFNIQLKHEELVWPKTFNLL